MKMKGGDDMKKLCLLLAVCLLFCLTGCTRFNVKIEDHTWQMLTVQKNELDSQILACSPAYALVAAYVEGATVVDMVCTAQDGKLIITDKTNQKTYEGTYEITSENKNPLATDKETLYNVTIDGQTGLLTAYNEYLSTNRTGSGDYWGLDDRHAVKLYIGDYIVYFLAEGLFEQDFQVGELV